MNSHDWHHQAVTSQPSGLKPITVRKFERLNQQEQNEHWTALNRWMAAQPIDCPRVRQTSTRMQAEVLRNEYAPRGAKTIIGLSAANGVGKSTLIKRLAHQLYRETVPTTDPGILPTRTVGTGATVDWIPQVYITLRAASRIQEVNTALLSFLGYPTIGQTRATTTRVVEAIRTHGVQLLILDDAHMLKTSQADARDVLDYLKFLNTELGELGGTMILVGANLEDSDVYADAQIATRLAPLQLQPHAIFPVSERARFQAMLRGVEEKFMCHLDTATTGTLTNELAGEIWQRTQGYLGDIHRLITTVILETFDAGEDVITRERLRAVPLSARATAAEASLREAATQRSRRTENRRKKKAGSTPPAQTPSQDAAGSSSDGPTAAVPETKE
ncbi:GTPase SAR1 family protein [Micrococcus cohnii]|uniref:GTPase SAR1 family protein n=1 Tax=Micrococcus cohnii TaxID=993416 RepID=A0A7W7GQ24_9MICC|nr:MULTISPECIES: TniB family NTP-binding protein [Micrococcus]MBB4736205.1 GTPase SAR1 family protein [Micrococcus cohnii]MCV7613638.1 TniB family NTP-binding protein [Micrococcus luteus]TWH36046.1 Panthothenate kinase [Micrococcus luteus J28]